MERWMQLAGYFPQDLKMIIFNIDGGRGSLKLLMLLRFFDDPLLITDDDRKEAREPVVDYSGGFDAEKAGSVNRYHQLRNIPGGQETLEVFRELLDSTGIPELQQKFAWVSVFWNDDNKAANMKIGLGNHSSRYSSNTSLYSQREEYSKPHVLRSTRDILRDNDARVLSGGVAMDHHSVVDKPCELFTSPEYIGE